MAFGLTDTGFQIKRLEDIKAEIEDSLRSTFGNQINLLPESVFGQIVGIFSERESLIWEQLESIHASQYPDGATGNNLDLVASITGTIREGATKSRVDSQLLFGTLGTLVPTGTQFSVDGTPTTQFVTLSDVTLVAGADEVQDIDFSAVPDAGAFTLDFGGQTTASIAFSDNAAAVQAALEALSGIGSGNVSVAGDFTAGFTVTFQGELQKQPVSDLTEASNTLTSGGSPVTITITETTPGVVQGEVSCEATVTGALVAPARSLTVIDTPVGGLSGTINPDDATVGQEVETDASLRTRREVEIQTAGASTVGAIASNVSEVVDVTAVIVFQNNTSVVDGDGRPPHSVEVVVQGGDQTDIAETIFENVAAGIETVGGVTETITDSQGFSQTVKFSRPTEVPLLIECDLSVNASTFPADGETLAAENFKAEIDSLLIGETVIVIPKLIGALNGNDELGTDKINGIEDAVIRISKKPTAPTTDDNIAIEPNELASVILTDITVTVV